MPANERSAEVPGYGISSQVMLEGSLVPFPSNLVCRPNGDAEFIL